MNIRIGLLWHSLASGNLGVRALTLSQLAILERIACATGTRMRVTLFENPADDAPAPTSFSSEHVEVCGTYRMRARDLSLGLATLMRAFRRCDLLIDIGEGDSFTDVYGDRRYLKQVFSKLAALVAGRRLVLAPQTIGPFSGPMRRALPAFILGRADAVFVRDEPSAAFAASLSPGTAVGEATDLAFRLPFDASRRAKTGVTKIGLNVSGLLYNQRNDHRRFGLRACYPRLVDDLIAAFLARSDCELHLIPHVAAERGPDEDSATCRRLAATSDGVVLAPGFTDPREAKSYIAGMDFFIGARMHACIAAFSAGVPLLPLAYTRKTTGLFGSVGYPVVGDLVGADEQELLATTMNWFERRDDLVPALIAGNAVVDQRLLPYEGYLARLVERLRR